MESLLTVFNIVYWHNEDMYTTDIVIGGTLKYSIQLSS